jgi:hypothetical protein
MKRSGIDPATFRFVAQCLLRQRVLHLYIYIYTVFFSTTIWGFVASYLLPASFALYVKSKFSFDESVLSGVRFVTKCQAALRH